MTTNEIKYVVTVNGEPKEVTFSNRDIEMGSGKIFENNAMVAETLEADTIDVVINMAPARTRAYRLLDVNGVRLLDSLGAQLLAVDAMVDVDPTAFLYGETIKYYRNGVLDGKFYARQARQIGKYRYSVEGISAVGLLIWQKHDGGMYNAARIGDVIADIMGAIPYTIDQDVANLTISGWLPAGSARDNLQQVLFSCGASITKNANKDLHFMFMGSESVVNIPSRRIYEGGRVNYRNQVTAVDVTEHAFFALSGDVETVLFNTADGTGAADHYRVSFDVPMHDLTADGLTIHESNCNYAIVSGTGTLSGKEYTHTERIIHKETEQSGQTAEENIMSVSDAYLVTSLNSLNVAERVAKYYGRIHESSFGVVLGTDAIKPTAKIQFTNPFGVVSLGYIRSAEKVMSGVVRSDLEVVTDWTPGPFGSNYNNWQLLTASGSWVVPAGVTRIRASLIGGGRGGFGGYNGEQGGTGGTGLSTQVDRHAEPGNGGAAGPAGGSPGRVAVYDIDVTPGQSFAVTIGTGGAGGPGGTEPAEGAEGGATTFGTRSSASGLPSFVVNLFTGEVYGEQGDADGIPGGRFPNTLQYKGVTYNSGPENNTTATFRSNAIVGVYGNGSGPAAGSNGHDGGSPGYREEISRTVYYGGAGGAGADAIAPDDETHIGKGGRAGNGGGGGGGGGGIGYRTSLPSGTALQGGSGGRGGYGSAGGKGGPGGVLIYW